MKKGTPCMESQSQRSAAGGTGLPPLARPTSLRSAALRGAGVSGSRAQTLIPSGGHRLEQSLERAARAARSGLTSWEHKGA